MSGSVAEVFAQLDAALDVVAAVDLLTLDREEIGELTLGMHVRQSRMDAQTTRVTGAFDTHGDPHGALGTPAWLAWKCRITKSQAEDEAQDAFQRRKAHCSRTFENTVQLDALLDPVGGGIFSYELNRLEQTMFEADWAEARSRLDPVTPTSNASCSTDHPGSSTSAPANASSPAPPAEPSKCATSNAPTTPATSPTTAARSTTSNDGNTKDPPCKPMVGSDARAITDNNAPDGAPPQLGHSLDAARYAPSRRDATSTARSRAHGARRAGNGIVDVLTGAVNPSGRLPVSMPRNVGFAKVPLEPGEARAVRFIVDPSRLAFYDPAMRFVIEPGAFTFRVGDASATVTLGGDVVEHRQRDIVATAASW